MQSENKAEVEFDTSEPQHWDKLPGNEIENMPNLKADDGSSGTPSNPHCSRVSTKSLWRVLLIISLPS